MPTLVIHGDDDQVVPFAVGGQASAALVEGARLKVYPGAPHGITDTHKDELSADLLAFARGEEVGEPEPVAGVAWRSPPRSSWSTARSVTRPSGRT